MAQEKKNDQIIDIPSEVAAYMDEDWLAYKAKRKAEDEAWINSPWKVVQMVEEDGFFIGHATKDFTLYVEFCLGQEPGEEEDYINVIPMDYEDYDHFVGVFGKFNPYILMWAEPTDVEALTYEALVKIRDKILN